MFSLFQRFFPESNKNLEQALQRGAVIVDVRTPSEFGQGHVVGSKNIPLDEIKRKAETIRKWNKPVITVCRSGARSAAAKGVLQAAGVEVYNGGAWTNLKTK